MRSFNITRKVVLTLSSIGVLLILSCRADRSGAPNADGGTAKPASVQYSVIPVQGASWLRHLGLRVSESQMGEMGGTSFVPATPRREPEVMPSPNNLSSAMRKYMGMLRSQPQQASQSLHENFVLAGADLYRMNCRACHGPEGKGAPPEINSLLGPVQGMSPSGIRQRMKARGLDVDESMVQEMASQAEIAIRKRLQNGGEKMPAFKHLRGDEVDALLGYLERLAGVADSKRSSLLVDESAARVGEHVMKGTCHVCHDATGPGGGHMAMMQGIIPSLASLPQNHSLSSVIEQAQYGSPRRMMMSGDRMPALPYFTEEEIAAGYYYLVEYPPQP